MSTTLFRRARTPWMIVLSAVLSFFFALSCFAAGDTDTPVVILKVEGEGIAKVRKKSGLEKVAGTKDSVFPGDRITTDAKSVVHLGLPDGTVVKVGLNSEYRIQSVQMRQGFLSWVFYLARGSIRALVEKTADKKNVKFRVNTPVGTVGVRGTELVVVHDVRTQTTYIYTIEGSVEFGAPECAAKKACRSVNTGQSSSIRLGQRVPSEPGVYDVKELLGILPPGASAKKNSGETGTNGSATASGAVKANDSQDSASATGKGGAAEDEPSDVAQRLALFRGLKQSTGNNLENVDDEALRKLVSDSSEEYAEAQDRILSRDKEQRVAMATAIKNGTYNGVMATAEAYSAHIGLYDPAATGGVENYFGQATNAKFRLGQTVQETTTFRPSPSKSGSGTGGDLGSGESAGARDSNADGSSSGASQAPGSKPTFGLRVPLDYHADENAKNARDRLAAATHDFAYKLKVMDVVRVDAGKDALKAGERIGLPDVEGPPPPHTATATVADVVSDHPTATVVTIASVSTPIMTSTHTSVTQTPVSTQAAAVADDANQMIEVHTVTVADTATSINMVTNTKTTQSGGGSLCPPFPKKLCDAAKAAAAALAKAFQDQYDKNSSGNNSSHSHNSRGKSVPDPKPQVCYIEKEVCTPKLCKDFGRGRGCSQKDKQDCHTERVPVSCHDKR